MKPFYLLIDSKFFYSYLANKWYEAFASYPNFEGILVRGEKPSNALAQQQASFHREHAGKKHLSGKMQEELSSMYHDFGNESKSAIRRFGAPNRALWECGKVTFLGKSVNSAEVETWLDEQIKGHDVWIFSHQGEILKPFWIEKSNGQLLNIHTAVLPYARGAFAI